MDKVINYLIQDSGQTIKAIDSNRKLLDDNGFLEETYQGLVTGRQTLTEKERAQNDAVKYYNESTSAQNAEAAASNELLKRVFDSAASAFDKGSAKLASFKIHDRIPESVKKLCSRLDYTNKLVAENKAALTGKGITEEDCDKLATASIRLDTADTAQEQSRKLQKSATLARDTAAKELKDKLYKFRKFIKARFSKKPEILVLFEPIPEGRGGGTDEGGDVTPPENPPADK